MRLPLLGDGLYRLLTSRLSIRHFLNETDYIDYEIVRYITPYDITFGGGPQSCGWTIDVTDYQFLLHDAVTLKAYIETWMGNDNGWLLNISFEMVQGIPDREPFAIAQLYSGRNVRYGDPEQPVEDALPEVTIDVPSQATWAAIWLRNDSGSTPLLSMKRMSC